METSQGKKEWKPGELRVIGSIDDIAGNPGLLIPPRGPSSDQSGHQEYTMPEYSGVRLSLSLGKVGKMTGSHDLARLNPREDYQ